MSYCEVVEGRISGYREQSLDFRVVQEESPYSTISKHCGGLI